MMLDEPFDVIIWHVLKPQEIQGTGHTRSLQDDCLEDAANAEGDGAASPPDTAAPTKPNIAPKSSQPGPSHAVARDYTRDSEMGLGMVI